MFNRHINPVVLTAACLMAANLYCAGRKATFLSASAPAQQQTGGAESISEARTIADSLWQLRGNPAVASQMIAAYEQAAAQNPADHRLLARLSRTIYLVANYIEQDPLRKDSLFLHGITVAEKALALHQGFRKTYETTKDEIAAVKEIDSSYIDAVYWYAANLGKWAATKSVLVRLSNKTKLEAFNKRTLNFDEYYFFAAPHRFFGALPTKTPGGDLNLAKKHFERAIELAPDYFGTRTLYAEYYAVKAQDKQTFVSQLEYIINRPCTTIPEIAPENCYEQEYAKKLLERTGEWFE